MGVQLREASWNRATARISIDPPNVLGVSCAAGPARRSQSGAAVAANELRRASGDLQPP
jgi:hypothetical protein